MKRNTRLQQARMEHHLSQHQLADEIGADKTTIGRWERGEAQPGPYFRQKLCEVLGRTAQELGLLAPGEEDATAGAASVGPSLIFDPAIPPGKVHIVGRDQFLTSLGIRLTTDPAFVVALYGLPGIGKTTLAMALVHDAQVRTHFSGGILWAGLGPHPNELAILARWGTLFHIGGRATESAERVRELRTLIGEQSILIVLDDVWNAEDTWPFLQLGGAQTRFLLTSRFPEVAAKLSPEPEVAVRVGEFDEETGMAFLRQIAPGVVEAEPEAAAELVRATGGLPLALTLMGHYLREQARDRQLRRIRRALADLHEREIRLTLPQPPYLLGTASPSWADLPIISLKTSVDLSIHALDEPVQRMLSALAIFPPRPNTFSEAAALAMSGGIGDYLDRLTDVGVIEASGPGRYSLHQTIADYAWDGWKGLSLTQQREGLRRLLVYYETFVPGVEDDRAIEGEFENMLALLHEMEREDLISEAIAIIHLLVPFLFRHDLYPLLVQQAERLLANAGEGGKAQDLARALSFLSWVMMVKEGPTKRTQAGFQEAIAAAKLNGDEKLLCRVYLNAVSCYQQAGAVAEAEALLAASWSLAQQSGPEELLLYYQTAIRMALETQRSEYTHTLLEEALEIARTNQVYKYLAIFLTQCGQLEHRLGHLRPALQAYEEALEIANVIHRPFVRNVCYSHIVPLRAELGDIEQAEQTWQEWRAMQSRSSWHAMPGDYINLLTELVRLRIRQGHLAEAWQAGQEVVDVVSAHGSELAYTSETVLDVVTLLLTIARTRGEQHTAKVLEQLLADCLRVDPFFDQLDWSLLQRVLERADHSDK